MKDIIENSEDQSKLFYSYIKSKSKVKETIQNLEDEGQLYAEEEEIYEVLNTNFLSVFTQEQLFEIPRNIRTTPYHLKNINLEKEDHRRIETFR